MSLLVVGSIAYDTIETPMAKRENVLGGSAPFFAYAAGFFCPVQMVGVVGADWLPEYTEMFRKQGVDTSGVEIVPDGKTFRWSGKYHENMNDRDTLDTQLNVLGTFQPKLPEHFRRPQFVFLANGAPSTGLAALDQIQGADLVVADTMNLWINIARPDLDALMKRIDGLVINDSEAKMLTGEINTVTAARKVLAMGPRFVIVKKGEHGAMFVSEYETYVVPAFPVENVVDPTGAGDSFAGGLMGYIASNQGNLDAETIKNALVYGTIAASFGIEGFSFDRYKEINRSHIDERRKAFQAMTSF
ncbi:MAG: PfkB family carbohydrate kinase [Planctomycetaceae bacterium]|jgi:sugar/nucleoside kinase (ribokinase family)|nr:PfkB family carbohydrate kinase [Planctomycetaceae bacterium]